MIKRTLLAVAISATLFSLEASANNNVRANSATSAATPASVGHRPVQLNRSSDGINDTHRQATVTGELTTGATLTLTGVEFSDNEKDDLDIDKMVASTENIKWYLVNAKNEVPSGNPAGEGKTFKIPADAAGKKIKVVYRIMTVDGSRPDAAFMPSTVLLNTATSGVTAPGGGDSDGTISAKLAAVNIKVTNLNGAPNDSLNGVPHDTPDKENIPVVGGTLTAELTCAVQSDCDTPEEAKNAYTFQWQMADAGTTSFSNIPGATDISHVVTGTQQNKLFQVVVIPKTTKADAPATKAKRR
ncbi:hypothetical protein D5C20_18750 [Salmonella enterica subsp. enterica serovar Enteritidis]|nr:hypothetical protein [Salmonella enterica subsp. enterica serovar Enteritidis]